MLLFQTSEKKLNKRKKRGGGGCGGRCFSYLLDELPAACLMIRSALSCLLEMFLYFETNGRLPSQHICTSVITAVILSDQFWRC